MRKALERLFENAADAVRYASAYHAALSELDPPIRARVGVHVGEVLLRENRPTDVARGAKPLEVDGIAKAIAARVMSLASGGQLGGSQAGARLFYNVTPAIAAVLRSSSEINRRGGELAAGVRVQPLRSLPLWITAERRFQLGKYGGGRDAFALFAESGIYGRPMPLGLNLDAYAQGGVV